MSFTIALTRLNERLFNIQENRINVENVYDVEFDSIFEIQSDLQLSPSEEKSRALKSVIDSVMKIIDSNLINLIVYDVSGATERVGVLNDEAGKRYVDIILDELTFYKEQLTGFLRGQKLAHVRTHEPFSVNLSVTNFGILIGLFYQIRVLDRKKVNRTKLMSFFSQHFHSTFIDDKTSASALYNSSYSAKEAEKKTFQELLN